MLCKIVPINGDESVELQIDTDDKNEVEWLIDKYKDIHKNVRTIEGFIEYATSRGYTIQRIYPILYDL